MDDFRLSSVLPGDCVQVKELIFSGVIRRRLMDLGFLPGTKIICLLHAPSGSPILLETKGFRIALRTCDCDGILVNTCEAD